MPFKTRVHWDSGTVDRGHTSRPKAQEWAVSCSHDGTWNEDMTILIPPHRIVYVELLEEK